MAEKMDDVPLVDLADQLRCIDPDWEAGLVHTSLMSIYQYQCIIPPTPQIIKTTMSSECLPDLPSMDPHVALKRCLMALEEQNAQLLKQAVKKPYVNNQYVVELISLRDLIGKYEQCTMLATENVVDIESVPESDNEQWVF
ncbi:hypothetical protein BKA82DRAFT_4013204 [Pisolithus tinctorius]|nr:hypothetical protein BKA82DRAFT_4013204 [Pisolithus tinctorius]